MLLCLLHVNALCSPPLTVSAFMNGFKCVSYDPWRISFLPLEVLLTICRFTSPVYPSSVQVAALWLLFHAIFPRDYAGIPLLCSELLLVTCRLSRVLISRCWLNAFLRFHYTVYSFFHRLSTRIT